MIGIVAQVLVKYGLNNRIKRDVPRPSEVGDAIRNTQYAIRVTHHVFTNHA